MKNKTGSTVFFALVFGFIYSCVPNVGMAASFPCSNGLSNPEKMICSNPKLSLLDEQLSKKYGADLQVLSPDGKQVLRNGEKRWVRFVIASCYEHKTKSQSLDCMEEKYTNRIKDMETAAIKVGPFIFSRIDYFYYKSDSKNGKPYEGQTSYPRIDNVWASYARQWNLAMAKTSIAQGDDWCEGLPGDVDVRFEIKSASEKLISAQVSDSIYCHGAAHEYNNREYRNYILKPDFHLLKSEDLFLLNQPWKAFITKYCIQSLRRERMTLSVDQKSFEKAITDTAAWSFTPKGLTIDMNTGSILGSSVGETTTTISWNELKPFLSSNAPISH